MFKFIKKYKFILLVIILLILFTMFIFKKPSGSDATNPQITYEEKINIIASDHRYGYALLDKYDVSHRDGSWDFMSVNRFIYEIDNANDTTVIIYPQDPLSITYYYGYSEDADHLAFRAELNDNQIINYSEPSDSTTITQAEAIKLLLDIKPIIDDKYAEYIESKYNCTYTVDCEYQSKYQKWRENA